jgi:cytochrome c biogenesis protein CcdA
MDLTHAGLAFVAGLLSILSPCVLPLLPIVLGAAQSRHRLGPAALGLGLALSFTLVGLFVATIGFAIGLDGDLFRRIGGAVMILIGAVLLVPSAQRALATAGGPLTEWAHGPMRGLEEKGPVGQAAMGLLLGLVWAPCVGPTLGAASVLAAQGENLGLVFLTMLTFGVGAALPLVLVGLASRPLLARLRGRVAGAGQTGKTVLGVLLLLMGLLIISGLDRALETWLVDVSPMWLTQLTTRY